MEGAAARLPTQRFMEAFWSLLGARLPLDWQVLPSARTVEQIEYPLLKVKYIDWKSFRFIIFSVMARSGLF